MTQNIGIKLSNKDSLIATDRELLFSSKFSHLKLLAKGKATSTAYTFAHGLGYPPLFAGYIKTDGKYFLNYSTVPSANNGFENSLYGKIRVDKDNLYADCTTGDRLIWLLFCDPAFTIGGVKQLGPMNNFGIKFSQSGFDCLRAKDSELSLTSKYGTPFIVEQGVLTVTAQSITVNEDEEKNVTNFTDKVHSLGYAAHLITPDTLGNSSIAYYVGPPIGWMQPYVWTDFEVYIDDYKIRLRVSRYAIGIAGGGPFGGPTTFDAVTYNFNYFLTNIRLPG